LAGQEGTPVHASFSYLAAVDMERSYTVSVLGNVVSVEGTSRYLLPFRVFRV
jgi:hypothetical protein